MAGGGMGDKAILNEFTLPAKCELIIRSLMANTVVFMTNKVTEMCDVVTLDIR